jgi:SAM-dependent methyltransferase
MPDPHDLETPSPWVVRWARLVPPGGEVLDLACGSGRHARFLASLGHRVLAVDRDPEALARLAGVAGVRTALADLEGAPWPFGAGAFDGVVVTNYLHRPLFAPIAASLAPGGVLIYETFMQGNERYGKPSNPAFLLRPNELAEAFGDPLELVAFEQGRVDRPKPAAIQRACAVRGPAGNVTIGGNP